METTHGPPTTHNANSTSARDYDDAPLLVSGIVAVLVFYALIFAVGLYASWLGRKRNTTTDDVMLAGRNISFLMGIFTMTATWVGGGFINGTAEKIFTPGSGLVWTQAPIGYSLSLFIGGLCFARQMRDKGYVTMLDPFEERFGQVMTGFLFIPALLGEVFWCGAVLSALGSSLAVILGIEHTTSVLISAGIAVFYTVIGGLYSVSFTDVVQLICIFFGLWMGAVFAMTSDVVAPLSQSFSDPQLDWLGTLHADHKLGYWIDSMFLMVLGGIPWQAYFQRVLAVKVPKHARWLSMGACLGCLFLSIPAALIGIVAKCTDWSKTEYANYGPVPIPEKDYKMVLPMVLRYVCPLPVALIGLGAVSAAVMSSADSSILSSSTMFAKNIYKPFRNYVSCGKKASDSEIVWTMRMCVIVIGCCASALAISVNSIYVLFKLCADLSFCILMPQFICVIHVPYANTFGSVAGYVIGLFVRISGGEKLLGFTPLIKYPWYDEHYGQLFPFKTLAFLISLSTIIFVSRLAEMVLSKWYSGNELKYKSMLRTNGKGQMEQTENDEKKLNGSCDIVMMEYKQSEKI